MNPQASNPPVPRWPQIGFLTALAWIMLGLGWRRWTHPIIDFGRELYVPWRLGLGDVLYRDLAYFNGPLSPYLNSLAFRFFGVSYSVLVWVNLGLLILATWLLHRLLRQIADRFVATTGCALFLTVFALADLTGAGNYNFVTPYAHEMTHATLLSLLVFLQLGRYLKEPSRKQLIGLGALLGLVFLTKAEFFLAAILAILVALGIEARQQGSGLRVLIRRVFSVIAVTAIAPFVAWLLLSLAMPWSDAFQGVLGSWGHLFNSELGDLPFYQRSLGFDRPGENLAGMLLWSALYALILLAPCLVALKIPPQSKTRRWTAFGAALWTVILLVVLAPRLDLLSGLPRPLPLILVAVSILLLIRAIGQRDLEKTDSRAILRLSFTLYSLILLAKMALYPRFDNYGFALALPAMMSLVVILVYLVPKWIDRRGGYGPAARLASMGFLSLIAAIFAWQSIQIYGQKNFSFGPRTEGFKAHEQYYLMQRLLERLPSHLQRGETLLALPEGIMLNYELRTANPTPHINFMPPALIMFGEDRMIAALDEHEPDVVVWIKRSTREYGFEEIGRGYGEKLMSWIAARYAVVDTLEDPALASRNFGKALVLRRSSEQTNAPPEGRAQVE
jgi:hypothetical protein